MIALNDSDANQRDLLSVHGLHGGIGASLVAEHHVAQLRIDRADVNQIAEPIEHIANVVFGDRPLRHDLQGFGDLKMHELVAQPVGDGRTGASKEAYFCLGGKGMLQKSTCCS